ncbi:MAG: CopD family protein [bacterium]
MLWVKSFHIIFVVTWFAGLFYLPRLFIYHNMTRDADAHARFLVMEKKLMAITVIGGVLAVFFGSWLVVMVPGFLSQGWLHAKITLVLTLIGYQYYCFRIMAEFKAGDYLRSDKWLRFFNEYPAIILIAVVLLVELKPF